MMGESKLRVGLSISTSGKYAALAQQSLDGIRLWCSYQQRSQPKPDLIWYDDKSRAAIVRQNVERLIEKDRIDLLFGPYSSSLTLAAAEVSEAQCRVLWNHGGTSDELARRGFCHLVTVPSPASDYFGELPNWLTRERPGARSVLVLHSTRGTFGVEVARGFIEAAERSALEIRRSSMDSPEDSDPDDYEFLVVAGSFEQEIDFLWKLQRSGRFNFGVAAVAAGVNAFSDSLGTAAEGVIGASQWEPALVEPVDIGPDSDWFVRAFRKTFGYVPDYPAAAAFATAVIAHECLVRTGSRKDLRLVETARSLDARTLFGRFRLSTEGNRQIGHRILLTRWRRGRRVLL